MKLMEELNQHKFLKQIKTIKSNVLQKNIYISERSDPVKYVNNDIKV